jgi:long-chain fatty acid transport protein
MRTQRMRKSTARKAVRITGVALLALLATRVQVCANPLDNYGFGSRWVAMGGAVTALVDDVGAIYYNPAGLVRAESVQVTVGYFYADPNLKINGNDIGEDSVSGLSAGFVMPPMKLGTIRIGSVEIGPIKMGGGGGVHIPDKRVSRSLAIPYDQPTFIRYGARNQRMVIMTPFSFEIFPWLQVGAMVSMYLRASGGPDFLLRENRPDNRGLWSEGSISATQRPSFFPTAGIQANPWDPLHLGFCYRGKNESLYKIPMKVHIEPLHIWPELPFALLGESLIDMNTVVYTFFSPEQFSFSLGYDWGEFLTVGLDINWERWSAFRQPAPEGATYYSGGIAVLVPPNPNYPLPAPDFHDIVCPALGVEYRPLRLSHFELCLRGGYRFQPSPAPEATGWNNFLVNNTHVFSAGVGLNFLRVQEALKVIRGPIRLDIHAQYFWLTEGEALKTNPVSDGYGDMVFGGHVFNGGASLTLQF